MKHDVYITHATKISYTILIGDIKIYVTVVKADKFEKSKYWAINFIIDA